LACRLDSNLTPHIPTQACSPRPTTTAAPQDKVPPFDSNTALAILQANLGAPADMVFAEFDATPIAAASLGQVHLATLQSGEKVVVKVQRPGLKELFDIDLKNIRWGEWLW
jgi:predicted unusual protein kinase regulating ubiquinone biosynthesis (AarF/ABC1/UbiB family)